MFEKLPEEPLLQLVEHIISVADMHLTFDALARDAPPPPELHARFFQEHDWLVGLFSSFCKMYLEGRGEPNFRDKAMNMVARLRVGNGKFLTPFSRAISKHGSPIHSPSCTILSRISDRWME